MMVGDCGRTFTTTLLFPGQVQLKAVSVYAPAATPAATLMVRTELAPLLVPKVKPAGNVAQQVLFNVASVGLLGSDTWKEPGEPMHVEFVVSSAASKVRLIT